MTIILIQISELEAVSCIVSIGLPVHGLYSSWTVSGVDILRVVQVMVH